MQGIIFLAVISLSFAATVLTPFGERPSECVLQLPSGSTVTPNGKELLIKIPATETTTEILTSYIAPDICSEDINEIKQSNILRKPSETNGWLDNVGWYPPTGQNNLQSFNATYTVPQDPVNNHGSQVLFYFIGMQDNDASAVNIVQPVLTWGNGYKQWYVESWACCPANITVSSPPLFGLNAGSTLQGSIQRASPSTWKIDSIFNGKHTTLNAQVGDYIYNWADITLEVYKVNTCQDFARGKMIFSSLDLVDSQGQQLTPQWKPTGATLCGGSIQSSGSNSYYIEHSQA
jgi:hypothetical protein